MFIGVFQLFLSNESEFAESAQIFFKWMIPSLQRHIKQAIALIY